MKAHIRALVMACVVPIVFAGCCTTRGQCQAWEYKVLQVSTNSSGPSANAQLNDLAQQGWVLVSNSAVPFSDSSGNNHVTCVFVLKRPRK
jgi:hypothetical protein